MSDTPYHFGSPFKWEINSLKNEATANNKEQESEGGILANSYNVCVFEEGFREDLPEFGIPSVLFETVPLNLEAIEQAIGRWEPEAIPQITEEALSIAEQSQRILNIEIGG